MGKRKREHDEDDVTLRESVLYTPPVKDNVSIPISRKSRSKALKPDDGVDNRGEMTDDEDLPTRKPKRRSKNGSRAKSSGKKKATGSYSKAEKRRKGKRRSRRKRGVMDSIFLTIFLSACIIALIVMGVKRVKIAKHFEKVKEVVCIDRYYEGTNVEQINISGMTQEEALTYWNQNIEPNYMNVTVTLNNGEALTASQLGYTSNYAEVLNTVFNSVRKGSIEERYNAILEHKEAEENHSVQRRYYDDAVVRTYVDQLAESIDTEPQDARLLSFNTETYSFEYQDEVVGAKLDREQLVSDIEATLDAGGGSVTLKIDPIEPSITRENVASNYGMISYAVTNASSSSSNRLSNIKLALSVINGTALAPGEVFSFNQVVGERTKEAGYKEAPAYVSGTVTDEIGGGICQVSTTVFNAAVKADLKIVERHEHSMTVSYVDPGKDAAVDWGNKDLRFENTSSDVVYICCYLTNDKRIRVGVFGKMLPNGESIVVETKKTRTIDYETQYQLSFELGSGEMKVYQEGKKGARATTYKVRLDAQGNEISREELFKSEYKPQSKLVFYGQ